MKKINMLLVVAIIVVIASALVACNFTVDSYSATLNDQLSFELTVGQQDVDFTQYFVLSGFQNMPITVTTSMLDLTAVDLSKPGTFDVVLTYKGCTCTATFTVVEDNSGNGGNGEGGNGGNGGGENVDPDPQPLTLAQILERYSDSANWNFVVDLLVVGASKPYEEEYKYFGQSVSNMYTSGGTVYTDYLEYDAENVFYYSANDDGTFTKYTQDADDFWSLYDYLYLLDLTALSSDSFDRVEDHYEANDASIASAVFADFEDLTWQGVSLYVFEDHITKLVFEASDGYSFTFTFSGYGTVSIDFASLEVSNVVDGGGSQPDEPVDNPQAFVDLLEQYDNYESWNFTVVFSQTYEGETYTERYDYLGYNVKYSYTYDDVNYVEYLAFGEDGLYYYYIDNGDGTYDVIDQNKDDFWMYYAYMMLFDHSNLAYYEFAQVGNNFEAVDPNTAGIGIFGDYGEEDGTVWVSVVVTVVDGKIAKLEGVMDDDFTISYTLSNYGQVNFDLPQENGGEQGGGEQGGEQGETSLTSVFTNAQLGVGAGQLAYTTTASPYGYSADNGVQFLQKNGTVTIVSAQSVNNVTSVSLTVKTNQSAGMGVRVSVGDVALTSDGQELLTVATSSNLVTVTFTADSEVSGVVTITLIPNASKNSMYLSSVSITVGENGGIGGEGGNGGEQGGEQGGESTTLEEGTYKSTFVNAQLGVGEGELQYTANLAPSSFVEPRGLQFMQKNGAAQLTSVLTLNNVSAVTVIVQTNCTTGMYVSVKVGDVNLTCYDEASVLVPSSSFDDLQTLTFIVLNGTANGQVVVTLTPSGSSQSMYLNSIAVTIGADSGNGGEQGGETPQGPENMMPQQHYNPTTFDNENLQDKMLSYGDAIGLPSTGTYNALVIPIQFVGDAITQQQLIDLNIAFNGTCEATGWESVRTYYQKSSFGALNLTFDVQPVYNASYNSTYYKNYQKTVTSSQYQYTDYGYTLLLAEVLSYYESILDLTKYDSNGDGCIDAVYLIYSAPVDYDEEDFYWAYVTWYYGDKQWDGLDAYYLLFAGIDFMYDDVNGNEYAYRGGIDGLNVNAGTYIHETGHLLGLDDYYDYYEEKGCNEGLGCADMMDYAVGDQNVYSKIMLGWTTPTIVTTTCTITINASPETGDCILIPLNFDNSYFGEYLLIDLYTSAGVNALDSAQRGSYLYGGAKYGVRIYHVSSNITGTPYSNDYGSFTDYNNSTTAFALIKLVEADGETKFVSDSGYAAKDDLWNAGSSLNDVYGAYERNDGKAVNFDISIVAVSATSATITITFYQY